MLTHTSAIGATAPIGVYDSGVGGLSVLQALQQSLAAESFIYVADTAYVPYGDKSRHTIIDRALALTDFFLDQGAKALVVPCNTATAAAVTTLRDRYPSLPIIGIEPAVKPAARLSRSGVIGVLATTGTLASPRFRTLVRREAGDVSVLLRPCPTWVRAVEDGHIDDAHAEQVVAPVIRELISRHADVLVLGCTHFPFLLPPIRRLAGATIPLLETGSAVARQLQRQLTERGLLAVGSTLDPAPVRYLASGDPERFARVASRLLSRTIAARQLPERYR